MPFSPFVVALFGFVLASSASGYVNTETLAVANYSDAFYPDSWISDLFYQALVNFTVRNVGSTACQKQGEMYEKNLRNYTHWAVRMAESWIRHPVGILDGNRYQFGVYDECVSVNYPVKGQYCLSEIKLSPINPRTENESRPVGLENRPYVYNGHAWKTVLEWVYTPDQGQRNILHLGICIPDSCTATDLQTSLQNELNKVFIPQQVNAVVNVDPIMCTVRENKYPYNTAYYVFSAIMGLLVTLCSGVTIYHFIQLSCNLNKTKAGDTSDSILYSFSIIKSLKDLLKYEKDNDLNILNGFKVLTMVFILFGHRFMYLSGSPLINSKSGEDIYSNGPDLLLTTMNLVDPFFFLSGFVMFVTLAPVFKKSGPAWMKLISPTLYRIVRMLPSYCVMMALTAHVMPHLGDGPLWQQKTWDEAEKCKTYWWTNLLFINNFIDIKYQCLIVSWYISCDIQFFIIGIIIVYFYTKNIKWGVGMVITALGISLIVPFVVTILTKSDGLVKVYIPLLENPRNSVSMNETYRKSYMRATPYFVGLATGFIVEKLQRMKFKLSLTTVYISTFIIVAINIWIQLIGAIFYDRQRPYYPIEHALYAVLSHCTWSIIGMCILICHFTCGYGSLGKVFSNRLVVPMGRLSFSVFLVNLNVMMMSQSSQRLQTHLSVKSSIDAWIYDAFKCYLVGLALYLIVEAPFANISRHLFGRGKPKISKTNGISVDTHKSIDTQEINLR